jgi:hypothetical protein
MGKYPSHPLETENVRGIFLIAGNSRIWYIYNSRIRTLGIVWWLPSGNGREEIMNTLEVLTLVLVIFAALSYIDNHRH